MESLIFFNLYMHNNEDKLIKIEILAFADSEYLNKIGCMNVEASSKSLSQNVVSGDLFVINILLDGTGILSIEPIESQIERLRQLVYNYNGEIHEPNYLRFRGDSQTIFEGQIKIWNIHHILFCTDKKPLRTELTLHCESSKNTKKKTLEDGSRFQDLTHKRKAQKGDTLQLMCYRNYGDVSYYLGVAKYNRLKDLINVEPGQEIIFPPMENLEKGPVPKHWRWIFWDINENIRNILNTKPGTRIWFPLFGCGITTYLFDNDALTTEYANLKNSIYDALLYFEPRIAVNLIDIKPKYPNKEISENNYLLIHMDYRLTGDYLLKHHNPESNLVFQFVPGGRFVRPIQSMKVYYFFKDQGSEFAY